MTEGSVPEKTPSYFLAFIDGAFHYDCGECDALCCRGHGFSGSLKREMTRLLEIYPELGATAVAKKGDVLSFPNPPAGCHFLESDRSCSIEKKHGRALKPGLCVLFPFNRFIRVGGTLTVSPHFLCPLRLQVPARPGAVAGTHALIEEQLLESSMLPTRPAQPPPALFDTEARLQREQDFLAVATAALGRTSFRELVQSQCEDNPSLEAFLVRARTVLGWGLAQGESDGRSRDAIDDLLVALATPVRIRAVALTDEETLRLLALCEIAVRHLSALTPQPPTLQSAAKILQAIWPSLKLLALADRSLRLPKRGAAGAIALDARLNFLATVALDGFDEEIGVLTTLEKTLDHRVSVSDRAVLLGQLGRLAAPAGAPF